MTTEEIDIAVLQRLLNVIGGNREDLRELIQDFIENAPVLVSQMRAAGEAGDWNAMRIASHTLKSNAREFGAMKLGALCEALEHECKAGPVAAPYESCLAIEAQEATARAALGDIRVEDV